MYMDDSAGTLDWLSDKTSHLIKGWGLALKVPCAPKRFDFLYSKRRNSLSKLAQVHEQRKFTHGS